ncbi:MAG: hypothetical protein ACLPH3_00560 [Terracidiphilus sp.]
MCMGLASCESPLKHLGISITPKKSTLAYANEQADESGRQHHRAVGDHV